MGYKHGTYQQEGATAFQLPVVLDYGHFIECIYSIQEWTSRSF